MKKLKGKIRTHKAKWNKVDSYLFVLQWPNMGGLFASHVKFGELVTEAEIEWINGTWEATLYFFPTLGNSFDRRWKAKNWVEMEYEKFKKTKTSLDVHNPH